MPEGRNESRFQRWRFGVPRLPGASPQASMKQRRQRTKHISSWKLESQNPHFQECAEFLRRRAALDPARQVDSLAPASMPDDREVVPPDATLSLATS
jgi:hypothetical protein